MADDFKILNDASHIRLRFQMYGGSQEPQDETVFVDGDFHELTLVGGLLKVVNEIIDNSVDEYVRTRGDFATEIEVKVETDGTITVKDNGRGIPTSKVDTPDGPEYQMVSAFTRARAGSNFDDSDRDSIGMNGVGSMITFVTSELFEAWSGDGLQQVYLRGENGEVAEISEKATIRRGTVVKFKPDYRFFNLSGIDQHHVRMLLERIKSLALSFPDIKFKFNNKRVNTSFTDIFGKECTVSRAENATFGVMKSNGSFQSHSLINGLSVKGGSHIDFFISEVVPILRDRIKKKHKLDITPARLKQHLRVHCVMNGFSNLKFDSQTKERVTNSFAECREAIGDFNPDGFVANLMKNKELIEEICAYTRLQEDLAAKKDLTKLQKRKKIKSDKFIDSIGDAQRIMVVEGLSAMSGLMNILGRKGIAFYALKGVPLNVLEVSHQKFMANTELSELYAIMTTYPDAEICIATDADADGSRIRGLTSLFVWKFFPHYFDNGKLRVLQTPIAIGKKKNKVEEWAYSFAEVGNINSRLDVQYQKGLGSWSEDDLKTVISTDGLETMLPILTVEDTDLFYKWFGTDNSQYRKDQILVAAPFDIMRV